MQELTSSIELQFCMTNCFGGLATDIVSGRQVLNQLQTALNLTVDGSNFAWHAMTEICPHARAVAATQVIQCIHMFTDVVETRVPEPELSNLRSIQERTMALWQDLLHEHGDEGEVGYAISEEKEDMACKYVVELSEILSQTEFRTHAECTYHPGESCPITPRASEEFRGAVWIETGSTTCTPFSRANRRKPGFLSKHTLASLVWFYSLRYYEPDFVLHEQVAGWDESMMVQILGMVARHSLKCSYRRPTVKDEVDADERRYGFHVQLVAPKDLGIPTDGVRKYAVAWLEPLVQWHRGPAFAQLFFRRLEVTADVYMMKDTELIKHELELVTAGKHLKGLPAHDFESLSNSALSTTEFAHLEDFRLLYCDGGDAHAAAAGGTTAIVNLANRADFSDHMSTSTFPRPMCASRLYCLVSKRVVLGPELWVAQGFPHPQMVSGDVCSDFSFPGFDEGSTLRRRNGKPLLARSAENTLVGNSMHWAVMGSWFLYILSKTDKSRLCE